MYSCMHAHLCNLTSDPIVHRKCVTASKPGAHRNRYVLMRTCERVLMQTDMYSCLRAQCIVLILHVFALKELCSQR